MARSGPCLKLAYPVENLNGKLLLPAGTPLTPHVMAGIETANKAVYRREYSLLGHGILKKDLLDFINNDPYKVIFSNRSERSQAVALMGDVRVFPPFLEYLDYFKQNDFYTYRHVLMVFALTTLLAINLDEKQERMIQETAMGPAHDFGKISVPLNILKKATPLTRAERAYLEHHTCAGFVLASYYLKNRQARAAKAARDHHERRNGAGYPTGILQKDLLVEIIAISDIYDALISPRPYRPVSYDNRSALEEITRMAERGEISWKALKLLVSYNRTPRIPWQKIKISSEKRGAPPAGNFYGQLSDKQ